MSSSLTRVLRLLLSSALALVVTAALVSCTSSGDGGVGGTNDYLDGGAEVVSAGPTGLEWIDFVEVVGTRTTTCIAVEGHRVLDLFAVAFTISYDERALRYTGYDDDATCVGAVNELTATLVDASTPGVIIVGVSRNAGVTTAGVDGCGRMIELCFDIIGEGDTPLTFTGNRVVYGPPPTGTPIAVEWVAAEVRTRL